MATKGNSEVEDIFAGTDKPYLVDTDAVARYAALCAEACEDMASKITKA